MQDDSKLRRDPTAANQVISELRADNQANRTHIRSLAGMFDVLAETNPALAQMWQVVRSAITPDSTPEEQADIEQRADHRSSEIFDDINLNNLALFRLCILYFEYYYILDNVLWYIIFFFKIFQI